MWGSKVQRTTDPHNLVAEIQTQEASNEMKNKKIQLHQKGDWGQLVNTFDTL